MPRYEWDFELTHSACPDWYTCVIIPNVTANRQLSYHINLPLADFFFWEKKKEKKSIKYVIIMGVVIIVLIMLSVNDDGKNCGITVLTPKISLLNVKNK